MWPARISVPPSRAMSGKTCPGETMSEAPLVGSMAVAMVRARSCAEMPVEMPSLRFDRLREGRAVARGVGAHHELETQLVGARLRQRQADETAAMLGHEVDGVGRRHLRGDDEVALVLAILGVDEHDHAPVPHILENLGDRGQDALFEAFDGRAEPLGQGANSMSRAA